MHRIYVLAAGVSGYNPGGAPGTSQVMHLVNGIAFYGLIGCVLGVVLGGIALAVGHRGGLGQVQFAGAVTAGSSLAGAVVIALADQLVNWASSG